MTITRSITRGITRSITNGITANDDAATVDLNFAAGILPAAPAFTFTGNNVRTFRDATGARQTAAANVRRLDHDASGNPLGALYEGERENHFLNSAAPVTQTSGALATGTYTLWIEGTGSVAVAGNTATITGAGTATVGNHVTFVVTVTGTVDYTVTGTPTIVQAEDGPFPSSYIATAGAPVTRTQDLDLTTNISGIDTTQGTFLIEATIPYLGSPNSAYFAVGDGAASNYQTVIVRNDFDNSLRAVSLTGGGTETDITDATPIVAGAAKKIAFAYAKNDAILYEDGTSRGTDANTTPPTAIDRLYIGAFDGGTNSLFGWIKRFRYFPTRLSNDELIRLTT